MTVQSFSQNTLRAAPSGGLVLGLSVVTGVIVGLVFLVCLLATNAFERSERSSQESLRSLTAVRGAVDGLWDQAAFWAESAGRRINASDEKNLSGLMTQYKGMWPEADFSLYDRNGEPLSQADAFDAMGDAPVPATVRPLVFKALAGNAAKDVTRARGFVGLSAAVPLRSGQARVLVLTVPLDSLSLQKLKSQAQSNVAVLPLDDSGTNLMAGLSGGASTFSRSGPAGISLWTELSSSISGLRFNTAQAVPVDSGRHVGMGPLKDAGGVAVGVVFAAPLQDEAAGLLPRDLAVALCAGLVTALITAFCLRRYAKRLSAALATEVNSLADGAPGTGTGWPMPLQAAMVRVARTLKEYRTRAKHVEAERDADGGAPVTDGAASLRDDGYLRLFENAPVGIFQARADGPLVRVNNAFAMLLGYDSPVHLLTENVSFTDFCLYGDEIRNPLSMLFEQGGGRQLISLRKRDGRIGNFALLCVPLTSAEGDRSGVLECFLVDRHLEEQIARAEREREYASRQRNSLALLLAATCRQTQSYLEPQSGMAGPAPEPETPAEDGEPVKERRKSVLAAKAVLTDIYQIAMTEAAAAPPVDVPIDFSRFLKRLCRQTLPGMQSRGTSLRCEVADELLGRLSGPAPLLRHALQRALLAVTAPVRGGWASLSVVRDPNAPKSPGHSRVLFSASWSAHERGSDYAVEPGMPSSGRDLVQAFNAQVEPYEGDVPPVDFDAGTLAIGDEQEVIRYLAQKMRGDLLEGVFTNEVRSLQIIVPLGHLEGGEAPDDEAAAAAETGFEAHDDPALAAHAAYAPEDIGDRVSMADARVAALAAEVPAPLDILVPANVDVSGEYVTEQREDTSGPGMNILLVDDSLNNRLLFSLFLRDTKHRIFEAHDGQEGVEAFQHGHFDVIFMDMEMPLMDGYQATRIIRALEADSGRASTPIVGMTSYALPEFRRQCMLSGCSDFLSKPFSKIALFAILEAFTQLKDDDHEQADENSGS